MLPGGVVSEVAYSRCQRVGVILRHGGQGAALVAAVQLRTLPGASRVMIRIRGSSRVVRKSTEPSRLPPTENQISKSGQSYFMSASSRSRR